MLSCVACQSALKAQQEADADCVLLQPQVLSVPTCHSCMCWCFLFHIQTLTCLSACFQHSQGEFNLSNLQDGFLATAFLVGLLLASPIFSESCKHYSAFR